MQTTPDSTNPTQLNQAAEGSALYYALLYSDQIASQRAIATLHYIQTISTTLHDVSEPQVAEKKIHWWHEELARLAKQNARHPACIEVQGYLHSNDMVKAALSILSAAATERYNPFAAESELRNTLTEDYSARAALFDQALSGSLSNRNPQTKASGDKPIQFQTKAQLLDNAESASNPAALGFAVFDRLNQLPKRLRAGYTVFSDELYEQFGTSPEDLLAGLNKEPDLDPDAWHNSQNLIAHNVSFAFDELNNAELSKLSLPVQILCRIRQSQLKLWKKRQPNLLDESITLTPVRKFIAAYQCKRKFGKA